MNVEHHPIFQKFAPFAGMVPAGYQVDFLGCLARREFWSDFADLPEREETTSFPPFDECYFLWIHLLESIVCAGERYTMIELGAGYGEWAVRAFRALQQQGKSSLRVVAVEADPVHFEWMRLNFSDNGVDSSRHNLIQAAVTDKAGDLFFCIGSPQGNEAPNQWYGQAVSWADDIASEEGDYNGFNVVRHKDGWQSIRVPGICLADVTKDLDLVDFVHLDIQGHELKVISSAIHELNRTTRRLHVDTHSSEIDQALVHLLTQHGWECVRRYNCLSSSDTPYGNIAFQDGVQSWVNPRLVVK